MKLAAGVDIDIWCTKCKANTTGTVVAMVGGEIAQVTCKICGSGPKKYRPAKGKRALGAGAAASPRTRSRSTGTGTRKKSTSTGARGSSTPMSAEANLALWQTRRNEQVGVVDRYDLTRTYIVGDALKHPKWGLGFVEGTPGGGRMQVLFEDGRKLLVMSYKK